MYTLVHRQDKCRITVADDKTFCVKEILDGELEWEYIQAVTSKSDIYIQPIDYINSTTFSMEYVHNSIDLHDFFKHKMFDTNTETSFSVCHNAMNVLWEHRKIIVELQEKYIGIEHTDMTTQNLLVNLDDYSVKIMDIDSIRVKPINYMGALTESYKSTLNTIIHMQTYIAERRDRHA